MRRRPAHLAAVLLTSGLILVVAACATDDGGISFDARTDTSGGLDIRLNPTPDVPDAGQPADVPGSDTTIGCTGNEQCPVDHPYCDLGSGSCLECLTSADCGGFPCWGGVCEGGDEPCEPNTEFCDGAAIVRCGPDGLPISHVDCSPNVCWENQCAICVPGTPRCNNNDAEVCNARGTGWDLVETCESICSEGECLLCHPGLGKCEDLVAMRCVPDGSGWVVEQDCGEEGLDCVRGMCINACAIDPKNQTNAGCDFWAVDMDNAYATDENGNVYDAQNAQFAVIVSNTSEDASAHVTVTYPDGREDEQDVAARSLARFLLPPDFGLDGSSLSDNAFRVRSTRPVTVYQFNPYANEDVFSNDASVLMPIPSLGTEYYIPNLPTTSYRGYITVVGVEAGTFVTVYPTTSVQSGSGVSTITGGSSGQFRLDVGQVLNLEAAFTGGDFAGSRVVGSKPIAVFAGHEAAVTGEVCCADHLEQQLLPVSRWGDRYIATHSERRNSEQDHWQIIASAPNTQVTLTPNVASIPSTLQAGEAVRFTSDQDFVVEASEPVLVVQYLASSFEIGGTSSTCSTTADCDSGFVCVPYVDGSKGCEPIGDPAMILAVPTVQYRREYIFLTPDSYYLDYINIVAPTGTSVVLDDETIPASSFTAIGASGWGVHRRQVSDNEHVLTSDQNIGLVVYGYDDDVSYGYPGGLGLEELRPPESR